MGLLKNQLANGKPLRIGIKQWQPKRSKKLNSTWRMWMGEAAEYLSANGWHVDIKNSQGQVVGHMPFTAQDCHEFFVGQLAGSDDNGDRLKTAEAKQGEMLFMMTRFHEWCMNHQVPITIPHESEYVEMNREMVC